MCHQTLPGNEAGVDAAWCRGFFDAYPDVLAFRMAHQLMGGVVEAAVPHSTRNTKRHRSLPGHTDKMTPEDKE